VGHVACMWVMRNMYRILAQKSERKSYSVNLVINGRIILEEILKK
jgi:hypothetical protein